MTVRLLLLGSPTVEYGGKSLALSFERRHQLLAFLALKKAWVGRAELAAMFWPEQESRLAYTNLRKTLHRMQALSWAKGMESQGGALRFQIDTDVSAFQAALREGRAADALPMRRGELLAGFNDDQSEAWTSWLGFERDRLRLAWRDGALAYLDADIDAADAVELSARLLESDPLDESALRSHMSWLARAGHTARARQVYREFVDRLANDLGLTPSAELQALHDSVAHSVQAALAVQPPPAKSDTDFIGRAVELRRIATLMAQDDCRLLSLLGPGGMGKTRLARRALAEIAASFADGAVFVPLEEVATSGELAARVARDLGVSLAGNKDPSDQVIEFLRARHTLLVLDNFEHLVADASILQTLLEAAPRLKIIVTSRVRLALATEWLLPLEGLPCPDVEDQDNIEAFDAARLFVQAAQRVQPSLVPSVEAASIVEICHLVEGLPLALQLAAAWTRALSCDAIAAELRQGIELLQTTDSAHPLRHASIEKVFDQSWRLLSPIERTTLARLSVFRGGFTPEAARAVAGASLPILGALTDKSLLRKDGTRLFMHPLVHQLAALRLSDAETHESKRAHALYFNRLLAQLRAGVENGDREALQLVENDFENCRSAWRWSIAHDAAAVGKSATTIEYFCDYRARFDEGLALLRDAFECAGEDVGLRGLLLSKIAHLEYRLDRYADAETSAKSALIAADASNQNEVKMKSLNVLGTCCLQLGRLEDARRFFAQSLTEASDSAVPQREAIVLDHLALVEKGLGNYDEALRLSIQSLTKHRQIDDVAGEALCLNNLGDLYMVIGQYEAAAKQFRAGLALCDTHGLVITRGPVLVNLGNVVLKSGDLKAAEDYGKRALEMAEASGYRSLLAWIRLLFARIALARDDIAAARSELASAASLAIALGRPSLQIATLGCLAEILVAQGDSGSARTILRFASEYPATRPVDRDEILAQMKQLGPDSDTTPTPAGITLEELLHRTEVESEVGYAPLTASITRSGAGTTSAQPA